MDIFTKKMKNRNPKDLEKFRKMKVLAAHLVRAMNHPDFDDQTKYELFFEIAFKFGNINSPTLNQIYLEQYPNAMNILNVL